MTTTTPGTSRTARLLTLISKGDNAFNARDFAAVDAGPGGQQRHGFGHLSPGGGGADAEPGGGGG
jgi:hypothetical protein